MVVKSKRAVNQMQAIILLVIVVAAIGGDYYYYTISKPKPPTEMQI